MSHIAFQVVIDIGCIFETSAHIVSVIHELFSGVYDFFWRMYDTSENMPITS